MNKTSIAAICLALTGMACSSTTEPDKPYENFQLEIVWPRAADASFVGRYEIGWVSYGTGPCRRIGAANWCKDESGTVTSGQIPAGQDRWIVRFQDRCLTMKAVQLRGYYEARGPGAECLAGRGLFELDCHAELQTVFVEERSERSEPPEAAGCDPPGE